MKLAYFVHDLTDPAVARRVRMLRAGGADPVVLGFRRDAEAPSHIEGAPAIDLGRTYDSRLLHRAGMTALTALGAARLRDRLRGAEVIVARTLEMLVVADAARRMMGGAPRLVYECLDVHRLMLSPGAKGRALRGVERALLRRADLLIVSSPAFLDAYFTPIQGLGDTLATPSLLVENKVLELEPSSSGPAQPPPGPPWRIGWLGAIRCRQSLQILIDLAARRPDLVEVRIHGRPAYTEFDDFDAQVAAVRNLTFGGPYGAEHLARLYGEVHFAWAIDYMEEGLNSSWLLPNRLYEASRHGAVPIALEGVQTGRYLAAHGFGLRLGDPAELESVLDSMTPETYARRRAEVAAVSPRSFVAGVRDCRDLVAALAGRDPSVWREDRAFQRPVRLGAKGFPRPEHSGGEAV